MRAVIAIVLVLAASRVADGQEAQTAPGAAVPGPTFEVASVRANTRLGTSYYYRWFPDGRFRATNLTLRALINLAYDLRTDHQLIGAPRWIASERFDVEALPTGTVTRSQQRLMLQALLRDRFGLIVREQPVDVPVYALVRMRPDAPLPRSLRESTPCPVVRWDPFSTTGPSDRTAGERYCGAALDRARGGIVGTGASIASLIAVLHRIVDRRVLDRTGLTGRYDFELKWSPDPLAGSVVANAGIFTAIQELGLKLQPAMNPELGYVIESVQRPTPN